MIWLFIILFVLVIILISWLKSKNNFFNQSRDVLAQKRKLLIDVLEDREFSEKEIECILNVFDLFKNFPLFYKFDGATIVADIDTIKGLDVGAMKHDYDYQFSQHQGFWYYLKSKIKADINYGKLMRKLGVSWLTSWVRVFFLLLSTPFWILLVSLKGKLRKK